MSSAVTPLAPYGVFMARLSALRVDADAMENGEWINPGDEFDGMKLRVRGFTDAYFDAYNKRMKRAAIPFNGDNTNLPNATARVIRAECLAKHVFLDVKGLEGEDGEPVDAARFKELMLDPGCGSLVQAVQIAAGMVGRGMSLDIEDATKN